MRKEALDLAGLYPEESIYAMEEYDLGYRVIDAGYSIGYDPSVTIEHKESRDGRLPDDAKLRLQWVNKSVIAWRYLPLRYFVTTALMWSLEYVRRVRGHPGGYVRAWGTSSGSHSSSGESRSARRRSRTSGGWTRGSGTEAALRQPVSARPEQGRLTLRRTCR